MCFGVKGAGLEYMKCSGKRDLLRGRFIYIANFSSGMCSGSFCFVGCDVTRYHGKCRLVCCEEGVFVSMVFRTGEDGSLLCGDQLDFCF